MQETKRRYSTIKMAPDHKGTTRSKCKKCIECDEFVLECGSIKCAYCDCPAGVHILEQGNYIFLVNKYARTSMSNINVEYRETGSSNPASTQR